MLSFLRIAQRPRPVGRLIAPQFVCLSPLPSLAAAEAPPEPGYAMWQASFETFSQGSLPVSESMRHNVTISRCATATAQAADSFDVHVESALEAQDRDRMRAVAGEPHHRGDYCGLDLASAARQGLQLTAAAVAGTQCWQPSFVSNVWRMDNAWLHLNIAHFSIARPGCPSARADGATHDVWIRRWESPAAQNGYLGRAAVHAEIELRALLDDGPARRHRLTQALPDEDAETGLRALTREALQLVLSDEDEVQQSDANDPFTPLRQGSTTELQHAHRAARLRIF